MKAVVQRVSHAAVYVEARRVSSIPHGLLVLLGLEKGDSEGDVIRFAEKLPRYRFFEDPQGKMNLSLLDIKGSVMVVSQFTLAADLEKGLRPSFDSALEPGAARELVAAFINTLRASLLDVAEGVFGAHMDVELINHGPVTFIFTGDTL